MSKKPSAPADVFNARVKALRSIGLAQGVSLRGKPTPAQKKSVAAAFKKNREILDAPAGTFTKQSVKDFFPGQIKALEKSGIKVVNGQAFIRTEGYKTVKIVKKNYKDKDGFTSKLIGVERAYDNRKSTLQIIGSSLERAGWRERLLRDQQAGHLKDGQFIALQAFDNSPMARSNTIDIDSLFKYESQIKYHGNAEEVREGLQVVIITVKELRDIDANKTTRKQQNAAKYQRKKKEMKTQSRKLGGRIQRK